MEHLVIDLRELLSSDESALDNAVCDILLLILILLLLPSDRINDDGFDVSTMFMVPSAGV